MLFVSLSRLIGRISLTREYLAEPSFHPPTASKVLTFGFCFLSVLNFRKLSGMNSLLLLLKSCLLLL